MRSGRPPAEIPILQRSSTRTRLTRRGRTVLGLLAIVVAGAGLYWFFAMREEPGTNGGSASPHQALCRDLGALQTGFRVPALTRVQINLREDAKLYAEQGDKKTAADITNLVAVVGRLKNALQGKGDLPTAIADMQKALRRLPRCRAGA